MHDSFEKGEKENSTSLPQVEVTSSICLHFQPIHLQVLRTNHLRCPECGGTIKPCNYRGEKGHMVVYGISGVRHVIAKESRCQDCRWVPGWYRGSWSRSSTFSGLDFTMDIVCRKADRRSLRKMHCKTKHWVTNTILKQKNITSFSVITNQTAADVNFCFRMVLAVYYHAATFEGLADEFNDTHSKGQDFIWAI